MQPELPAELLDHVFLFLRLSEDISSLRACARVNMLFTSLVERYIWYHLTIHNIPTESRSTASIVDITSSSFSTELYCPEAFQLLTDKPHIAGYIKSLTMKWSHTQCLYIAHVLSLLPDLERVVICDHDRADGTVYWGWLDNAVREAFVRALRSSSLREVGICRIQDFPLDVVSGIEQLERLELDGIENFNLSNASRHEPWELAELLRVRSQPRSTAGARLKSLSLQNCMPSLLLVIAWLYSSNAKISHFTTGPHPDLGLRGKPDISELVHLKVTAGIPFEYEYLPYILSLCRHSLEVLELDPGGRANLLYDANPSSALAQDSPARLLSSQRLTPLPTHSHLPTPFFTAAPEAFRINYPVPAAPIPAYELFPPPRRDLLCVSLQGPFSLGSLEALRQLKIKLEVESLHFSRIVDDATQAGGEAVVDEVYTTPFEWLRRVLEELSAPPLLSRHTSTYPPGSSPAAVCRLVLELLTLDMSFKSTPAELRHVSFAPLASALSSLSSSVPSLKRVEIKATNATKGTQSMEGIATGSGWIMQVLEEDVYLAPLIEEGLVGVLGI